MQISTSFGVILFAALFSTSYSNTSANGTSGNTTLSVETKAIADLDRLANDVLSKVDNMSTFYMSSLYANIVQSIRTIIDNAANTTELQSASNGTNFQIEACGLRIANCCAEIHIEKNGANGDYNVTEAAFNDCTTKSKSCYDPEFEKCIEAAEKCPETSTPKAKTTVTNA